MGAKRDRSNPYDALTPKKHRQRASFAPIEAYVPGAEEYHQALRELDRAKNPNRERQADQLCKCRQCGFEFHTKYRGTYAMCVRCRNKTKSSASPPAQDKPTEQSGDSPTPDYPTSSSPEQERQERKDAGYF